jgi:hypothetical protein
LAASVTRIPDVGADAFALWRRRLARKSMRQVVIVLGGCLGPARLDEFGDDAVERRPTFDRRPAG